MADSDRPSTAGRCLLKTALDTSLVSPTADVQESHSAGAANRHLALISPHVPQAVEWGGVDRNPAAGVKVFKEEDQHQRFLSPDEIGRIFAVMEADPNQTAIAALKLLLLTGMRLEEASQARWVHVDLAGGQWWLPKTKNGRRHHITLSEEAKALLTAQPWHLGLGLSGA